MKEIETLSIAEQGLLDIFRRDHSCEHTLIEAIIKHYEMALERSREAILTKAIQWWPIRKLTAPTKQECTHTKQNRDPERINAILGSIGDKLRSCFISPDTLSIQEIAKLLKNDFQAINDCNDPEYTCFAKATLLFSAVRRHEGLDIKNPVAETDIEKIIRRQFNLLLDEPTLASTIIRMAENPGSLVTDDEVITGLARNRPELVYPVVVLIIQLIISSQVNEVQELGEILRGLGIEVF